MKQFMQKRGMQYSVLLLLLIIALAGCSKRAPEVSDYKQTTIDASTGGTVQIAGPAGTASFGFPAGVLSQTTKVEHGIFTQPLPNPTGDITIISPVYYIGPSCLNDRLTGNINISLPYVDGSWPGGKLEQNLSIVFFDKKVNSWSIVPSTVNISANVVNGTYNQVCIFAIGATAGAPDAFSIDLNALPTTIAQGDTSELNWEVRSLTGNNIQKVTLLQGRNGNGQVLKVFEDVNDEKFVGTLNVQPTEATEYTLEVTDGTSTQIDRVTVNVLARVDVAPVDGVDKFRYPIGSKDAPGEFKFTVSGGNLTYIAKTASESIKLLDETGNRTIQINETGTVNFTVTCDEEINDTVQLFSPTFGNVGSFQVVCYTPPGTLKIIPNFAGGTGSATALVQGQDSEIKSINKTVALSSSTGTEIELPSGNYVVSFSEATNGSGQQLIPSAPRQEVFIPPSKTIEVPINYYVDDAPNNP